MYVTWLEGKYNTADSSSKLFFNPIEVINKDLYRHGPKGLTDINSGLRTIFYKVNSQGEEFIPLPEHLIIKARKKNEDITKSTAEDNFKNT